MSDHKNQLTHELDCVLADRPADFAQNARTVLKRVLECANETGVSMRPSQVVNLINSIVSELDKPVDLNHSTYAMFVGGFINSCR